MGEEESDVDIEGFEEDDDGKPKTPAPVNVVSESVSEDEDATTSHYNVLC